MEEDEGHPPSSLSVITYVLILLLLLFLLLLLLLMVFKARREPRRIETTQGFRPSQRTKNIEGTALLFSSQVLKVMGI